jgi:hypothetical protein
MCFICLHLPFTFQVPSFCKVYSSLGSDIHTALSTFRQEVLEGIFPSPQYSPYKMAEEEKIKFEEMMKKEKSKREANLKDMERKLLEQDEYEIVKLY